MYIESLHTFQTLLLSLGENLGNYKSQQMRIASIKNNSFILPRKMYLYSREETL